MCPRYAVIAQFSSDSFNIWCETAVLNDARGPAGKRRCSHRAVAQLKAMIDESKMTILSKLVVFRVNCMNAIIRIIVATLASVDILDSILGR